MTCRVRVCDMYEFVLELDRTDTRYVYKYQRYKSK